MINSLKEDLQIVVRKFQGQREIVDDAELVLLFTILQLTF